MKALIDSNGDVQQIVFSTDGYDLTGMTVIDNVPVPPHEYVWNKLTQAFEPRPPTPAEEITLALFSDPRWRALQAATPAQIDAWLAANVTTLARVQDVLKVLLLVARTIRR